MKYTNFILTVIAFLLFVIFLNMNHLSLISTVKGDPAFQNDKLNDDKPVKVVIVGVGTAGNLEDKPVKEWENGAQVIKSWKKILPVREIPQ